jgi:hypothetical protein
MKLVTGIFFTIVIALVMYFLLKNAGPAPTVY